MPKFEIRVIPAHEIIHDEHSLVHEWRVEQLTRLVIPEPLCSLPVCPQIIGTNGMFVLEQPFVGVCFQL